MSKRITNILTNERVYPKNSDTFKIGDKIRIIRMENPGSDIDDSRYNGRTGTIEYIDDRGQLHGTWGGLAVIPEVDTVEVITESVRTNKRTTHINEYGSKEAQEDYENWLESADDTDIERGLRWKYKGPDYLFKKWADRFKDEFGDYDRGNFDLGTILADYFENLSSGHISLFEELHNVISQDPKTKKWRILGHKGYWPQRYSTKEKAENALKAFHTNEWMQIENPQSIEELINDHGWKLIDVRKQKDGAVNITIRRDPKLEHNYFVTPITDFPDGEGNYEPGIIELLNKYYRKRGLEKNIKWISNYYDKNKKEEIIEII